MDPKIGDQQDSFWQMSKLVSENDGESPKIPRYCNSPEKFDPYSNINNKSSRFS